MSVLYSDNFENITELRVAGATPPKELAASIIHLLNDAKRVRLAAIGHQAVGQAVKAVPIVNQYCVAQGYLVAMLPSFALVPVVNRDGGGDAPVPVDGVVPAGRSEERTVTVMHLVRICPQ